MESEMREGLTFSLGVSHDAMVEAELYMGSCLTPLLFTTQTDGKDPNKIWQRILTMLKPIQKAFHPFYQLQRVFRGHGTLYIGRKRGYRLYMWIK